MLISSNPWQSHQTTNSNDLLQEQHLRQDVHLRLAVVPVLGDLVWPSLPSWPRPAPEHAVETARARFSRRAARSPRSTAEPTRLRDQEVAFDTWISPTRTRSVSWGIRERAHLAPRRPRMRADGERAVRQSTTFFAPRSAACLASQILAAAFSRRAGRGRRRSRCAAAASLGMSLAFGNPPIRRLVVLRTRVRAPHVA